MKRILSVLMAVCLVVSMLSACAAEKKEKETESTSAAERTNPTLAEAQKGEPYPAAAEFAGGSGTESDPYQIADAGQLALLNEKLQNHEKDYESAFYILTQDIKFNDPADLDSWQEQAPQYMWEAGVGSFRGSLDGSGHSISGLYVCGPVYTSPTDVSSRGGMGLFRNIDGGTVQNLTITDALIICIDGSPAGAFAEQISAGGRLVNCVNEATVITQGGGNVGGLAGWVTDGAISGCVNRGTVQGSGGIAGYLSGTMENCVNEGPVASVTEFQSCGGIAGSVHDGAFLSHCENKGSVTGAGEAGGIAGSVFVAENQKTVSDCRNDGTVRSEKTAGGLFGSVSSGDLFADSSDVLLRIERCSNAGMVTGPNVAGIADMLQVYNGASLELIRCENSGALQHMAEGADGCAAGLISNILQTDEGHILLQGCKNTSDIASNAAMLGGIAANVTIRDDGKGNRVVEIVDCVNEGSLTDTVYGHGGILGMVTLLGCTEQDLLRVSGCSNHGSLYTCGGKTVVCVGGIIGDVMGPDVPNGTVVLENCSNSGNIVFDLQNAEVPEKGVYPSHADGIIAAYYEGTLVIRDCVSTGEIQILNGDPIWVKQGSWIKTGTPDA